MSAVCDCLVVGNGVTAAAFAALVAKAGYRVVMVSRNERTASNRALSLMPATFATLQRLEIIEALRRSDAPKKLGLRWFDPAGDEAYSVFFCDFDPYESAQTWQVRKDDFQEMVVQQARKRGVAQDELADYQPMWDGQRLVGLHCQRTDGFGYEQYARVTFDTTGLLHPASAANADNEPPAPTRVMISGLYRGAHREPAYEGATLLFQTANRDGWFRYVPLVDNLVSLAAVSDRNAAALLDSPAEDVFEDLLVECPAAAERLVDAELVGEFAMSKHLIRPVKVAAENGRIIVPESLCQASPLIGAGSYLALKAGEWCADVVVEAMRATDLSVERLGRWIPSFEAAQDRLATLSNMLHAPGFSWREVLDRFPQRRAGMANLLAGKVFDESAMQFADELRDWLGNQASGENTTEPRSA